MDMSANTVVTSGGSCGGLNIVPPTKSPERESETPPRVQSVKPISFSNGVLKRHAPPQVVVVYKECLKNHAASLGGHALDGCGEFMPADNATASDPTSLKCAACGCHRNFHRRDPEKFTVANNILTTNTNTPPPTTLTHVIEYHPHHRHHPFPPPQQSSHGPGPHPPRSPGSQSPPPISSSFFPASAPHMLLALSSGGGADTPTPTTNGPHHHLNNSNNNKNNISQFPAHVMNSGSTSQPLLSPGSRKRFRTKFSQEQKEKMHEFAEKVGWKMQKINEEMVVNFCNEIGVERGVFKVWMHNNKNTFGKRSYIPCSSSIIPLSSSGGGLGLCQSQALNINLHDDDDDDDDDGEDDEDDGEDDGDEMGNLNGNAQYHVIHHHNNHHNQHYKNGGKVSESINNAAPTNGSSSSS